MAIAGTTQRGRRRFATAHGPIVHALRAFCHEAGSVLARADAARRLGRRGHWSIETRLHRPNDVTFGEDACLIRVGPGPTVLALLRDAALALLHRAGIRRIAAG